MDSNTLKCICISHADGIHPVGRVRTDHATRNVIEARVIVVFRSRSRSRLFTRLRSDAQSQVTMHYGKNVTVIHVYRKALTVRDGRRVGQRVDRHVIILDDGATLNGGPPKV